MVLNVNAQAAEGLRVTGVSTAFYHVVRYTVHPCGALQSNGYNVMTATNGQAEGVKYRGSGKQKLDRCGHGPSGRASWEKACVEDGKSLPW